MAHHMGIENMGGPAVGFLAELPKPTVTYGAVMTHDERTGEMTGFKYGSATGGEHAGMAHGAVARSDSARAGAGHAAHGQANAQADSGAQTPAHSEEMMDLHMRMLEDPVIRQRMMADTAMRRMMMQMLDSMPAEHRAHMEHLMRADAGAAATPAPRPRTTTQPAARRRQASAKRPAAPAPTRATKPAAKPTAKPATRPAPKPAPKTPPKQADPHAGHKPPEN
jgi:hypothetical protein